APSSIGWEPHTTLYGMSMPEQARNSSHVNDPKITAMLKEQMHVQDLEVRRKIIFDIQRYAAEQQYYVYLYCVGITGSWQPYVKNYAPNLTFDDGGRAAALWLDRWGERGRGTRWMRPPEGGLRMETQPAPAQR